MLAVLGLGSNKSFGSLDSVQILARACAELSALFENFRVSGIWRTKPMYVTDQADFYNMAVSGETSLSAPELLCKIHGIESLFGRNRDLEIRNGERSLDIDIELFGNEEINFTDGSDPMNNLEIPHPRLCERAFVLIPLLEVLPANADIQKRELFEKSLEKIGNQGAVKYLDSFEFSKIVAETGADYGRTDSFAESGCD